ncbi:MAG: hypothetical protein QNJ72_01775 [Pleurocapsa sp. MO_226.B13]|nr:hypothetical protein [Pleurocapsa sp. MO_226.B13]
MTQERARTEFNQAQLVAKQIRDRLREIVHRRIPLLKEDLVTLTAKIDSVKPEFEQLQSIKDNFSAEIIDKRDRQAKSLANSFQDYVLKLGDTFETDFVAYQPNLEFFDFLRQDKR